MVSPFFVGEEVTGDLVGSDEGFARGWPVGEALGKSVGSPDGVVLGRFDGSAVG